jgi:hypothetical protein
LWVGKDTEYNQYNFQYVTKYVCQPTPTPSPTPSPMPGKDNVCCLYYYAKDPSMTKTLCSLACPLFPGYFYVSNWTVTSCGDCFFHKK